MVSQHRGMDVENLRLCALTATSIPSVAADAHPGSRRLSNETLTSYDESDRRMRWWAISRWRRSHHRAICRAVAPVGIRCSTTVQMPSRAEMVKRYVRCYSRNQSWLQMWKSRHPHQPKRLLTTLDAPSRTPDVKSLPRQSRRRTKPQADDDPVNAKRS